MRTRNVWVLMILQFLLGLGAAISGGLLILAPDGHLLQAPLTMLRPTPFATFLLPGLLLFTFVGIYPPMNILTVIAAIVAAIVLVLHGLIHLMGTAAYMKLAVIQQLPYKTTLLNGRWELGASGTAVYGALWAVAAIGFIVAAVALLAGWNWWQPVLVGVTLFSLALTALDWGVAYTGVILNIAILALLWLGPRLTSWVLR